MAPVHILFLIAFAFAAIPVIPAVAITGDDPGAWNAPSGDDEVDAGRAAFEREDWPVVIETMSKVIERRPWDDRAHTLLGFAYRKLGRYDASLAHYRRALELNPHNRGALEYLGEAYLELDRPEDALRMLARLESACRRVADPGDDAWQANCEEWSELKTAYDAYLEAAR